MSRRALVTGGLACAGLALCVVAITGGGRARPLHGTAAAMPAARTVEHLVTVSRLSMRHRALGLSGYMLVANFPLGYLTRDTIRGRGTSMHFTINRDHYEEDWVTPDLSRVHWASFAYSHGRRGRLLHDYAFRQRAVADTNATVVDTFRDLLRTEELVRAGSRTVGGRVLVRYRRRESSQTWLAPAGSDVPAEVVLVDEGGHGRARYRMRHTIRIVSFETLPLHAAERHLQVSR